MRTLKRTLALILALVMVLGVMTMGASATKLEELGGSDKVADDYRVAMGVLVGMDVFQGDEKGELNPEATVTRAEMARLLYALVTGDVDSKSTPAITTQVFNDVPVTHWAAPYINWAQASGYLVGYGDGNFGPSDSVTGYQAMLMLLQALGYNKQGEIGGADYAMQTHTWAAKVGLTKNVSANYNSPATRQEIAQYLYDTMKSVRVFWSTDADDYAQRNDVNTVTYGLANFNFDYDSDNVLEEAMITSLPNSKGKITIDGSGSYDYASDMTEVGRIADVYVSTKSVVYYVDILSEDIVVKGATSEANFKKAVTNDNKVVSGGALIFSNYEYNSSSRTTVLTEDAAGGLRSKAIKAQDATYVIYEDRIESVLYANMTVEEVIVDKDGNIELGDGTDITRKYEYDGDENLTKKGTYYMNCVIEDDTYYLTDVVTITAAATRYYTTDYKVTLSGTTYKIKHIDFPAKGTGSADTGDNADITMAYKQGNTTTTYKWYVSGVTGNIIGAKEVDSEDLSTYGYVVAVNDSLGTIYARVILGDGTNKTYEVDHTEAKVISDFLYTLVAISIDSDGVATFEDNGNIFALDVSDVVAADQKEIFNQYTADFTAATFTTAVDGFNDAYVNASTFVYMGGTFGANTGSDGVSTTGGITVKDGIHNSNLSAIATQINGRDRLIWVKTNSSGVITVAFIEAAFVGAASNSDYFYYNGKDYYQSGSKWYVDAYNLETGAVSTFSVVEADAKAGAGVYTIIKDGSTYDMTAGGTRRDQIETLKYVSSKDYWVINGNITVYDDTVVMDEDDSFSIGDITDLDEGDYIAYAVDSKNGEAIGIVLLKDSTTPTTPTTVTGLYYYDGTSAWIDMSTGNTVTTITATVASEGIYQVTTSTTPQTATQTVTGYTFTATALTVTYATVDGDYYLLNGSFARMIAKGAVVRDTTGNNITTGTRLATSLTTLSSTGNDIEIYCVSDANGYVVACVVTDVTTS